MDRNTAEVAYQALGRIFWGVLICVLDFNLSTTTNREGFKFDVISDVIGAILIVRGLGQLQPLVFDRQYAGILSFCYIVAMVEVLEAIVDHFIIQWPLPLGIAYGIWSLVSLYAVFRFCGSMRIFCFSATLFETEATWITSERFILWLVLIPAIGMQIVGLMATGAGPRGLASLGPLVIAVAVAALVALIHLLLSIARTRTALRDATSGRFLP
jgi:hypothetical protein